MRHKTRQKLHETMKHLLICGVLIFAFFPLYIMFVISFKDNTQFVRAPFTITFPLHIENWTHGFNIIGPYIGNSIFVAIISVIATLLAATCAAYVFARYEFPFKNLLWYCLLGLLFMPGIMNLVPLFIIMRNMDMLNSLLSLSIIYATAGQVFCVFVLRNFIEEIPEDLFEAAQIDGASPRQQIWNIVVPMSGSILSTLAILRFIVCWNNFIQPLIFINDRSKQLIPVALMELDGEYVKQWGEMMACFSIAAIPLVLIFFFSMKLFVKGIAAGAIKG
jgi:ABC-type glycerol-3-phosphate transport system permease component